MLDFAVRLDATKEQEQEQEQAETEEQADRDREAAAVRKKVSFSQAEEDPDLTSPPRHRASRSSSAAPVNQSLVSSMLPQAFGGHADPVRGQGDVRSALHNLHAFGLFRLKQEVNRPDPQGWTAIMKAASRGYPESVADLILHGASRQIVPREAGGPPQSALRIAQTRADRGSVPHRICCLLLEKSWSLGSVRGFKMAGYQWSDNIEEVPFPLDEVKPPGYQIRPRSVSDGEAEAVTHQNLGEHSDEMKEAMMAAYDDVDG